MATYLELVDLSQNGPLRQRVAAACVVAAETIRTEATNTPDHASRLAWARNVFLQPTREADRMVWAVLAQNRNSSVAQITGATDAQVQTAVDAAVAVFM